MCSLFPYKRKEYWGIRLSRACLKMLINLKRAFLNPVHTIEMIKSSKSYPSYEIH